MASCRCRSCSEGGVTSHGCPTPIRRIAFASTGHDRAASPAASRIAPASAHIVLDTRNGRRLGAIPWSIESSQKNLRSYRTLARRWLKTNEPHPATIDAPEVIAELLDPGSQPKLDK